MVALDIINPKKYSIPNEESIKSAIIEVLEDKNIKYDVEIGLKIVSEEEIRLLNKKYRNKDYPTDVLSFPIYHHIPIKSTASLLLGDIIICFQKTNENAEQNHLTYQNEFINLIKHSILHLLGFHHPED